MRCSKNVAAFPFLLLMMIGLTSCKPQAESIDLDIELTLDTGKDIGQSLGTLFTLEDGAGRVVMGAGFPDTYNTLKRDDYRSLNVFIETDRKGSFETLERPFPDTTAIRLTSVAGELIAFNRQDHAMRVYQADGTWRDYDGNVPTFYINLLNNKLLEFGSNDIVFDGNSVLDNPQDVSFYAYYANGKMYIYSRDEQDLYVCDWDYDDTGPIDFNNCEKHEINYTENRFPYVFGQYEDRVLFNMNHGDRYSYTDGTLTLLHEDVGTSNQIYSMIYSNGRIYAGHYPTGEVLIYDGGADYELMTPNISIPAGFPDNSREAQTLQLYAGYLFAGVWPYGELHQYNFNDNSWEYLQRLFAFPDVPGSTKSEPYRQIITNLDIPIVPNSFGQRVNDLVLLDKYMYIALCNKGGTPYDNTWGFLSEDQLAEYGSVVRYQKDYNLACQFYWPEDGETTIRVTLDEAELVIYQDGVERCSLDVDLEGISIDESTLALGDGIYGVYGGDALTQID